MTATCRWCDQPLRLAHADGRWEWVHDRGGFPCRDPDTWLTLPTMAEPVPVPTRP